MVRLLALLFACNIIPLFSLTQLFEALPLSSGETGPSLEQIGSALTADAIIFMVIGLIVTLMVGMNLAVPFREIARVLEGVRRGDFEGRVLVTSNDEIGYTGDVINEMTEGLKDRERMRRSLDLAREVQQALLPQAPPEIPGLDVAGRSVYCDETGGDYYDFIEFGPEGSGKFGLVVGDVSDHGLHSALLMISARASLRHHACHSDDIGDVIADVNYHFCDDVGESGRFMTMFLSVIDTNSLTMQWARAGHDPAQLYDPVSGLFEELGGSGGMPLGIQSTCTYEIHSRGLKPGQLIFIGTDGVWETRNHRGENFGKERLRKVIKTHADLTARDILEAVLQSLDRFCRGKPVEDDVTLVIVKVAGPLSA